MKMKKLTLSVFLGSLAAFTTAAVADPPLPDKANWRGPCYNCYNHALNRKDLAFVQPPIVLGPPGPNFIDCANAQAAAVLNGLVVAAWPGPPAAQPAGWPTGACPAGQCLVALSAIPPATVAFIRGIPGNRFARPTNASFVGDYHWYRLNGDGNWSQKHGETPAICTDDAVPPVAMNAANPPHTADLGLYEFCTYMCVPAPPAVLPALVEGSVWLDLAIARLWRLFRSGLEDIFEDITEFIESEILARLPTLIPIADPGWTDNEDFRGYGMARGDTSDPALPPYMRVFNGVVAYYSDIEGDENTVITYYADDNGLEAYLASLFEDNPIPTVSEWGLIFMGLLAFTVGTILYGRWRRVGATG